MTKREQSRRPAPSRPRSHYKSSRPSRPSATSPRRRPGQGNNGPNWMIIGGGIAALLFVLVVGFLAVQVLSNGENEEAAATAVTATAIPTETSPTPLLSTETTIAPTNVPDSATVGITESSTPVLLPPDISALQQYMQSLINADRLANGQSELGWDDIAAKAGMLHAQEMASFSYLSHWNLEGYGPDYRYTKAGGLNSVSENVYMHDHSPNSDLVPTSAEGWRQLIASAQQALMESEGHKANILSPEHTAVGVGIAYDAENGRLRIAQEFIARYVVIEPLPLQAKIGEQVVVNGRLLASASNPLINLAYEPYPTSLGLSELRNTGPYASQAEIFEVVNVTVNADGSFSQPVMLNNNSEPGLYHVRIWVDTKYGQILAVNVIIEVR